MWNFHMQYHHSNFGPLVDHSSREALGLSVVETITSMIHCCVVSQLWSDWFFFLSVTYEECLNTFLLQGLWGPWPETWAPHSNPAHLWDTSPTPTASSEWKIPLGWPQNPAWGREDLSLVFATHRDKKLMFTLNWIRLSSIYCLKSIAIVSRVNSHGC